MRMKPNPIPLVRFQDYIMHVEDLIPIPKSYAEAIKSPYMGIHMDECFRMKRFKDRFIAKGYNQQQNIDFFETYSPVASCISIRLLLTIASTRGMKVYHFDISTAFLHSDIDTTIFFNPPEGFFKDDEVLQLNKSLYELKQSPRNWCQHLA